MWAVVTDGWRVQIIEGLVLCRQGLITRIQIAQLSAAARTLLGMLEIDQEGDTCAVQVADLCQVNRQHWLAIGRCCIS